MAAIKPVKVSKAEAMKDPLRVFSVTNKLKDDGSPEVEGQYQMPTPVTCPCCGTIFRVKIDDEYYRYILHEEDGCYFRV